MRLRALSMIALAALAAGACSASDEIPPELFGRWVTEEERYADRYVELSLGVVRFGLGEAGAATGYVAEVHRESLPTGFELVIDYTTEEGELSTFHVLVSEDHQQLRLKGQSGFAWTKGGKDG